MLVCQHEDMVFRFTFLRKDLIRCLNRALETISAKPTSPEVEDVFIIEFIDILYKEGATIATATSYEEEFVSSPPAHEDINSSTTASFLSPNFSEELGNLSAGGEVPVFPGYIRITSMVFCFVILGIGVIGNVMVPIVILKTKDMRNSTNIFLMNLSVADLMVLLVCTPTVLVEVNSKPETWVLGEEMCKYICYFKLLGSAHVSHPGVVITC